MDAIAKREKEGGSAFIEQVRANLVSITSISGKAKRLSLGTPIKHSTKEALLYQAYTSKVPPSALVCHAMLSADRAW
eukprot:1371779-Rhodomonas_salina.6